MCGILAFFESTCAPHCRTALQTLSSRGPDDQDVLELSGSTLGHTRLAVIDIAGGHQPMTTEDGRYAIVFNGEIYNFEALREALVRQGHGFRSRSDTEVLLRGYAQWGEGLVERLDGMFAFAIWDTRQRRVFAARDRTGIKPLFYSTSDGLIIGSTLSPFLALPDFPKPLNYEGLRDFLAYQTVLAPDSFLENVQQLPPACTLSYQAGSGDLKVSRYWDIPDPSRDTTASLEDITTEVDSIIGASVARQIMSDVPIGAFLSGGIDSSLMVHYMAEAGVRPLKTFSVRFPDAGFDETPQAQAVARKYGTEHHVLDAPAIGPDELTGAISALDQPLADPAYITTAELAQLTRQHVTVALSGDGGDELFGGYGRYLDVESKYPDNAGKRLLRQLLGTGLAPGSLLRRSLAGKEMLYYKKVELGPYTTSRKSLKRYVSNDAWTRARPERTLHTWKQLADGFGGKLDSDSLMRADLWSYLSENCLVKTDRASMMHGLEVRVPMLGNDVLDRALDIPARVHFQGGDKAVLRNLARRHLPETVWNRPKHGFSVPLESYFNGAWREAGDDYFARAAQIAPFLNGAAIHQLWNNARRKRASRRLAYTFLVLLIWLDHHGLSF